MEFFVFIYGFYIVGIRCCAESNLDLLNDFLLVSIVVSFCNRIENVEGHWKENLRMLNVTIIFMLDNTDSLISLN